MKVVRIISLVLTILLPVPALPVRLQFGTSDAGSLPESTSMVKRISFGLPSLPSLPSMSLPSLPSLQLPSLQQQKNLLLIGGGAILAVVVATIAYKLMSSPVTQLNKAIELTTNELQKFFKALQLFESKDWSNLYGWGSKEMKFLKQYDVPNEINLTDKDTVVKHVLANNKNMQNAQTLIRDIDPEILSDTSKTDFIKYLDAIIYQIALCYNKRIKDTRHVVYRIFSKPAIKTQLLLKEKNDYILPLLNNVHHLTNLITQVYNATTARITKQIEFAGLLSITKAAQQSLGVQPITEANWTTFIDTVNA